MRKKYSYRNKLIAALLLLTLLSVLILTHVKAEGTAQIWTDKADYAPEETVTIFGTGFLPESLVTVEVTRPDLTVDSWNVTSDLDGSFTTTYLLDGITGTYTVTATDGTNTATTTFYDAVVITLSPVGCTFGTATTVTVTGSGFVKNDPTVTIKFATTTVATTHSESSGDLHPVTFNVPNTTPKGSYTVTATGTLPAGSPRSGTATFTVVVPVYMTVSYSVVGDSTGSSAPVFYYKQYGVDQTCILTGSGQAIQVDSDTAWSVTNPLDGSTGSTRWQSNQAVSGTASSDTTIVFTYYLQLKTGASFSTSDGSTPSANVVLSSTQFGDPFTQNLAPSTDQIWLDAGMSWSVNNPIPTFPTTERWYALSGTSGTVDKTTSIAPLYYHQYLVSFDVNPSGKGSTSPSETNFYTDGAVIDPLSASPISGYAFASWSVSTTRGTITIGNTLLATTTATIHGTGTITANFQPLTVDITVTSSPTGSGFIKVDDTDYTTPYTFSWTIGSSHSLGALSPVNGGTGVQYVFTSWSDSGNQKHDYTVPSSAATVIAYYETQYLVHYAVTGNTLTIPVPDDEWVNSGSGATGTFPLQVTDTGIRCNYVSDDRPTVHPGVTSPITVTATYQTQYLVHYATTGNTNPITVPPDEWVNSGSPATGSFPSVVTVDGIKDTFVSDNRPSTITAPTTITATYQTSYWVQYAANVPVTVPDSEWVKSGQAATGVFTSPVISDGTKYVFVSDDRPDTITAPTTITATYDTYYWVQYAANVPVTVPSSEWVISGGSATGTFSTPQFNAAGDTKYVYVSDDRPSKITAPTTITATYDTYYKVHCAANVPVTVPADEWVLSGGSATGVFLSPQCNLAGDTKYVYVSDDRPATITAPTTITATYKTQYKVSFTQTSSGVAPTVTYTADTDPTDTVPFTVWAKAGTEISYSYQAIVYDPTSGIRYVLTDTSPASPQTVNGPLTITGTYKTQYYLTVGTSPAGVNSPAGQGWYDSGDTAHVSTAQYVDIVAGSSRYRFDSWTGATGTYADATVYMNAPKTATANYIVQYKLTVSTSPSGLTPQPTVTLSSGYTTGDGYYDTGSVVSIDPNSPAGYTFDHWNGDATGSTVPLSVTMNSAKNIIAVFTFNLAVETGFKAGDSTSFASDPYLTDIMCVLAKATSGYKLVGTSPGTFDYAIAIKNTGTTTFTLISISVAGSSDFVLQSSNPIRLLDATGADISAQFTVDTTWWLTSQKITSPSQSTVQGLLGSKSLYVTIHLDYKLKGNVFSSSIYSKAYTFKTTVTGTSGPNSGKIDPYGSVAFLSKKATVIYGFVKTSSGAPIAGARIELYRGSALLYTETTDADGFYCFIDGCDGVTLTGGTTYTVVCTLSGSPPPMSQYVIAESLKAVSVNFTKKD